MSQRAPVQDDSIDEGQVRLAVSVAGGGDDAAVAGELIPGSRRNGDETWLMAAVSGEGGERTSIEVVNVLRSSVSDASTDDVGTVLKQAYRRLNSTFYQQGMGRQTASAVALVANGKYATIAHVGDGRAYLLRAGRLNQITRDIAPAPIKSGKAREESPESDTQKTLLGSRERLDSRQPAVYEITLLPEDRLLLCTASVYRDSDDIAIGQELALNDSATALAALTDGETPSAAVAAIVSAARERAPIVIGSEGQNSPIPLIATALIILILIAVAAAYAFLT
ncbi:hypothetical protein BH09CHL1_BH09CHL1_28600 [soil metagenome]